MTELTKQVDVAIVGASIAGSAAATLYAERRLRVALIERSLNIDAYRPTSQSPSRGAS